MNKIIGLTTGLIAILMLTGCGSDSDSSSLVSSYSINDYQAVESSTSLEGTWVGISNYSEEVIHTGEKAGFVENAKYSKRRIFSMSQDTRDDSLYLEDHLFYGPLATRLIGNNIDIMVPDGLSVFPLNAVVTDNNKMTGTLSSENGDQDWVFVKISNSVGSIGTVSTTSHWTNSQSSIGEYSALVLIDEIWESKNNEGGHRYEHSYMLSFEESLNGSDKFRMLMTAKEDLLNNGNDELSVFLRGMPNTIEATESNVKITTSQSNNTSFIGTFSGVDDTDSNSVVLNVNLSF